VGVWEVDDLTLDIRRRIAVPLMVALLVIVGAPLATIATAAGSRGTVTLEVVERVNAGGGAVVGTPDWDVDTVDEPSPLSNALLNGNKVAKTTHAIDTTHGSLPPDTPANLFKNSRTDPEGAPLMRWAIPASEGDYRVRLYFAEINPNVVRGGRVFDVLAEGSLVLNDVDVLNKVGRYRGWVGRFPVVSDGAINLVFRRQTGSPAVAAIEVLSVEGEPPPPDLGTWERLADVINKREEGSLIEVGGAIYMAGGNNPATDSVRHERYSFTTEDWIGTLPKPPAEAGFSTEFHHAQAVTVGGDIYYVGGLEGPWPNTTYGGVQIFDPVAESWSLGTPMPAGRARGSAGTVVYQGDIYVLGGLVNDPTDEADDGTAGDGHFGRSVAFFDTYDPGTGDWTELDDMPRVRDHFSATVIGDKLYAVGGRKDGGQGRFANNIAPVDVYDFGTGDWSTLPGAADLPTPRAGAGTAVVSGEIIVFGGEGNGQAYSRVDAFDPDTNTWRQLTPMPTARHGIQAATCNGAVYIASGAEAQGGTMLTKRFDVFYFGATKPDC
jgi:N-acetylneuraminic acid mutarotase